MEYHIFDFCPLQVKRLKAMDKTTVEYQKELANFILGCSIFLGIKLEDFLETEYEEFKKKYNSRRKVKNFLFYTMPLWNILGLYMLEGIERISSTFFADVIAIILFLFFIAYGVILWKISFKNKKMLLNYVSKLIDDYVLREHNLMDDELDLVIRAFKTPHTHYDDSYCALEIGCYKCLKMIDVKKVFDGEYNTFECPYCKSDKLICKTETDDFELNKKLLEQIKEYWDK